MITEFFLGFHRERYGARRRGRSERVKTRLRGEELLLALGPSLVDVRLVFELLRQVFQTLEAHHLREQPLLERLLAALETLPRVGHVLDTKESFIGNAISIIDNLKT